MKITELLLAELDREAVGIRKTLERVESRRTCRARSLIRRARWSGPAAYR